MFKKLEKNEKGFTLVELVVVIAILAILAVLLVPKIMGNVDEAKASRHTANARTIASEIATYNALHKDVVSGVPIRAADGVEERLNSVSQSTTGGGGANVATLLGRDADDFPIKDYAEIVVDDEGNCSVDQIHTYSY